MDKRMNNEVKLIVVAIVCALLLVIGHVILTKAFMGFIWTEYVAAAIPFVMMGLCIFALRYAQKGE